jgi:hypothetical protein
MIKLSVGFASNYATQNNRKGVRPLGVTIQCKTSISVPYMVPYLVPYQFRCLSNSGPVIHYQTTINQKYKAFKLDNNINNNTKYCHEEYFVLKNSKLRFVITIVQLKFDNRQLKGELSRLYRIFE